MVMGPVSRQQSGQTVRMLLSYVSFSHLLKRISCCDPLTGHVTGTPSKTPPQQALCPPPPLPLPPLRLVSGGTGLNWTSALPAAERTSTHRTKLQAVFLGSGPSSFNFGELNLSQPGGREPGWDHSGLQGSFPVPYFLVLSGSSVASSSLSEGFHLKPVL